MATSAELKQNILNGGYDQAFAKLYGADTATVAAQRARYVDMIDHFEENFGTGRTVCLYSAPGRTEIGGNHTDHNNGVVIAAAVNLTPQPVEAEHSASLIRGVAAGIVKDGGKVGGFDCYTTSDVLGGSGLSSSAAFEVCMGAIFRGEYNDNDMKRFDQVKNAMISQYAENVFFGKPCGLMDQTACAVGKVITIDFKEVGHPVVREVPFDLAAKGFALCISDTKGSHADLTDDYAAVRREMESVAEFFGKKVLRDVDEETFLKAIPEVRKVTGDRAVVRAIHFYNDSRRAGEIYEAIKADDFDRFLQLIIEGGHSSFEFNQNAYSIKNPQEQGVPLALAISQKVLNGRGAWRLQGGGFAGTIQAFVPLALLETYKNAIDAVFGAGSCHVLSVRNYGAVMVTPDM